MFFEGQQPAEKLKEDALSVNEDFFGNHSYLSKTKWPQIQCPSLKGEFWICSV